MKNKYPTWIPNFFIIFLLTFSFSSFAQSPLSFDRQQNETLALVNNLKPNILNAGIIQKDLLKENTKPISTDTTIKNAVDGHFHEKPGVPHDLGNTSGSCVSGTISRFSGSYHSNLYIGNSSGTNVLQAWGQNMKDYTGIGTGNDTVPRVVSAASFGGVPLEVRSSSSGGGSGLSALVLRTTTKLYFFGTAANLTAITTMSGFGGIALTTAASDVTAKLPAGVTIADIAQTAISQTAFAIVTNSGNVYILSTVTNLQGDKANFSTTSLTSLTIASSGSKSFVIGTGLSYAVGDQIVLSNGSNTMTMTITAYNSSTGAVTATATAKSGSGTFASWIVFNNTQAAPQSAVWHKVKLSDGTTPLSGVTKFSLSSSGAFALTTTGKIYYWGAPANVNGVANITTAFNYAYDMSAQIPVGRTVTDLVCLGTKAPSSSTLFLLTDNQKVYACGLNANGVLGINNSTTTTNQATFQTVKGIDGTTDLGNIVRIDGDTEADIFCMGAMTSTGQIFGWGDSPAGMLGLPATGAGTSSYNVPKTVQLFSPNPGVNFTDFSVAGHFTIAFYNSGTTDQYWYLGHNTGGSIGDPNNSTTYIIAAAPASLGATNGVSFNCSNTQPTVIITGATTPFASCAGSVSSNQLFTIEGTYLSANITVTAPAGFEISTSSGSGFGTTATLTQSGGIVATTTIYVRIKAGSSGNVSGNITCSTAGAADQTIGVSGIVNALPTVVSVTDASRSGAGTLTLSGTASAGATLDWYDAVAGGTVLLGGTGTTSFTTPVITGTTTYFVQAKNSTTGCASVNRTPVTATINGSFAEGDIGADQSVCSGSVPAPLSSVVDASGGTGTITYQWQFSTTSSSAGFTDISGATLTTFVPPAALTLTTYYRRAATTSADGTIYSNVITITINALPVASAAVDNSRTGAGPVILSATASVGATLDWYANATGGAVLSGGNGVTTFTTPSINVTTTYFVEARNTTTGCISALRIPVVATINGSFSPGAISADQTICSGFTPSSLGSITDASGGTGTISYKWQSSVTSISSGFADIALATALDYSPGALTQTTYFRRSASTTTPGDGTIYSNVLTVIVNTLPALPTGIDGYRTGPGIVGLGATVSAGETVDWFADVSGGGVLSGGTGTTSFTTPVISVATTYYAQTRNSTTGCISTGRTPVIATINAPTPIIIMTGSITSFASCTGTVSSLQNFTVSGSDLVADIVVTAPTGYEISTTSGGVYTAAINLVPSTGTVGNTTIYVRLSGAALNGASGNMTASSTNAVTQSIATGSAIVSTASVGGGIAGDATVISGTNSTLLTISGYTGTITKWQSSTVADFSANVTDVANTIATYTATDLTVTTYFRAIVTNGVCASDNSAVATITVSGALPITWLSFTAKKQVNSVLLNWTTTNEQNVNDFLVQQSTDATSWKNIGTVDAVGRSSAVNSYTFLDVNPLKAVNYYRLIQRDQDGRGSYSKVVNVLFTDLAKQLSVFPNRISDGKLNIQLQQAGTVSLYNSVGELMLRKKLSAGMQIMNTGNLAKGIYLLQSGMETVKIIIE